MRKKLFSFLLVPLIMTLALLNLTEVNANAASINRIGGQNRYQTACKIAAEGWKTSKYAVLVTGENYPDALAAAPLSKKYDAPILLTEKNKLTTDTLNTIKQLKVTDVFIIGGTGVVSTNVYNTLTSNGIKVKRVSGANRYETSLEVAKLVGLSNGIFAVNGGIFGDALTVGPIAASLNMPIILTDKNNLDPKVESYLKTNKVNKSYIIGDSSLISDSVFKKLNNGERITGKDIYERNKTVLNKFENSLNFSKGYAASGTNFPDALAGSALAAKNANPLILTAAVPSDYTLGIIKDSYISNLTILGGEGAVSTTASNKLLSAASEVNPIKMVAKKSKSIALVSVLDQSNKETAIGTGIVISSDGKVITNYHVIEGAYSAKVTLENGQEYDVEGLLGYSKEQDIAVLKLKNATNLVPVTLGDSSKVEVGDDVIAIGNPRGFINTVSTGIISGVNRKFLRENYTDLQITASITNGSSGGALFNDKGEVIGITYGGANDGNLDFAIPINEAKPFTKVTKLTSLYDLYTSNKPEPPTGVTAKVLSDSEITIQWEPVEDADYYYVYFSEDKDGEYTYIDDGFGGKQPLDWYDDYSAALFGLDSGTTMYIKVTAVKDGVESDFSDTISASTFTSDSSEFLGLLPEVPGVPDMKYYSVTTTDDLIIYTYNVGQDKLTEDFMNSYIELLKQNGWSYSNTVTDGTKTMINYSKGDMLVGVTEYNGYFFIVGERIY